MECEFLHRCRIERRQHIAGRIEAFVDLEGQVARHQRLRAMEEEIEGFNAIAAPDGIDIAEAFGGDERGACALAFQHGVDGDCRAMQNLRKAWQVAGGKAQAFGDAQRRVCRGSGGFRRDDAPVDAAHQIGKCSADIDSNDVHCSALFDSLRGEARRLPGVRRRSARRTSSLKVMAMAASEPIRAKSGAGL